MKNRYINPIVLLLGCFALPSATQAAPSPTNVNVVNTPTVKDVDNAARHSFTATASGDLSQYFNAFDITLDVTTVPQGKRLVVEQLSAEYGIENSSDSRSISAGLQTTTGGVTTDYWFKGAFTGFNFDTNCQCVFAHYAASSQMRSYADAGTIVRFHFRRDYVEDGLVTASLCGYLIDVP
jgi:hypothetical protein